MKKVAYLLLFFFSICFISGCNNSLSEQDLEQLSKEITQNYTLPYMASGGVGLSLHNNDGIIEETMSFELKPGERFEKIISLGNMIDNDRKYKLLLFVDYKQTAFIVNESTVTEYDFSAKSNENVLIPFKIENLQQGFHDVFFVIAKYPDIHSLDCEYRKSTDMNHLLFLRFNILVGNAKVPDVTYTQLENSKEAVFDGILISNKQDLLKRWLTENKHGNDDLKFFIHAGNQSYGKKQNFAVITLLNWKQVEFNNNQDVIFFSLENGTQTSIPAIVSLPHQEGVYDLVTILVHNPYVPLDIYNRMIETGIRVGVNVQNATEV